MTINNEDERLEQDIVRAIKARGLMESMNQWDKEMAPSTVRLLWVRISRTLGYLLAAAAMLAGVLFAPITTRSTSEYQRMAQSAGMELHNLYLTAGGGSADLIYQATGKMSEGEFRTAYRLLSEAEVALNEEFTDHTDVQYIETLQDIIQLKAHCDLSRGQLFYTIRGKLNLRK